MFRLILFTAIFVVSLAGCVSTPVTDINSPYYVPLPGSRFIVNKEIRVDANKASAWFQGGRLMSYSKLDQYYPNCKFELKAVSITGTVIKPDVFIVTRTRQEEQLFHDSEPVRLADASIGIGIGGGTRSGIGVGIGLGFNVHGSSPVPYATIFYLRSETQPDVFRITCSHWEEYTDARHLTFAEIRQALGDYITIEVRQADKKQ